MKKYLLIFVMLIATITNVNSQTRKIVVDKQVDSVRTIEALGTCVRKFTDSKILNIGLQTWISPNDTSFCVITNVNSSYPLGVFNNARMLVKLMDDEVIELHSVTSEYTETTIQYAKPTITSTVWKNRITSTYNSNSIDVSRNINYWHVTPEIINKFRKGVKKVKIEFTDDNYEKEFKKDKFGEILYDSYISELNYINSEHKKVDTFKKDF